MDKLKRWTAENAFNRQVGATVPPSYPHEPLVKIFSSVSYTEGIRHFLGKQRAQVLEIGCMGGNNLRFFHDRGHACHGVEVGDDLIALCWQNLERFGIRDIPVVRGTNRELPFEDASFDALISINTLHYEEKENVGLALEEFRRVLRPGGLAFVETAGSRHFIHERAERRGEFCYVARHGDFRDGDIFGFFDDLDHFSRFTSSYFSESEYGVLTEVYPRRTLEFYYGLFVK